MVLWEVGKVQVRVGYPRVSIERRRRDETRVLLRHYLEQRISKAAVARRLGISERPGIAGSRRGKWIWRWTRGRWAGMESGHFMCSRNRPHYLLATLSLVASMECTRVASICWRVPPESRSSAPTRRR